MPISKAGMSLMSKLQHDEKTIYDIYKEALKTDDHRTVYYGEANGAPIQVAFKLYEKGWGKANIKKIEREIKVYEELGPKGICPNIIAKKFDEENGIYIIYELCNAEPLAVYLANKKEFPAVSIKKVATFMAEALDIMEKKMIYHGDLPSQYFSTR